MGEGEEEEGEHRPVEEGEAGHQHHLAEEGEVEQLLLLTREQGEGEEHRQILLVAVVEVLVVEGQQMQWELALVVEEVQKQELLQGEVVVER